MALEANIEDPGVYIDSLNDANPSYTDGLSQADDHIRGIKNCILNTFANITGAVTSTHTELNILDGVTSSTAELNLLTGKSLASSDDVIDNFPSGTLMLFQQTAAPTGWTKQTTHNDKALRVVSGTASSGGSIAFSTVFSRTATDSHTLTSAQSGMPSHSHSQYYDLHASVGSAQAIAVNQGVSQFATLDNITSAAGQNAASGHTHNIDIRVQYVDLIIASKD